MGGGMARGQIGRRMRVRLEFWFQVLTKLLHSTDGGREGGEFTVSCLQWETGPLEYGGPAGRTGALLGTTSSSTPIGHKQPTGRATSAAATAGADQRRSKQKADGKGERARVRMAVGTVMAVVTFHLAHF